MSIVSRRTSAILLTATLSHEALLSWGWRVPFLIAGPPVVAGGIGYLVDRGLHTKPWMMIVLGLVMPLIHLPPLHETSAEAVPERLARLMIEEKPKPPPAPPVELPKPKPEVKPVC